MIAAPKCLKCNLQAKHDPVDGQPTTCGRHAAANAARAAERMRKRHADPEFNPLAALTGAERADYDVLRKAGYTRAEAFEAMGRVL